MCGTTRSCIFWVTSHKRSLIIVIHCDVYSNSNVLLLTGYTCKRCKGGGVWYTLFEMLKNEILLSKCTTTGGWCRIYNHNIKTGGLVKKTRATLKHLSNEVCSTGRSTLHVPFECGFLPYHLQMQSPNYMHQDCNAPLFLVLVPILSLVTLLWCRCSKVFCLGQRARK